MKNVGNEFERIYMEYSDKIFSYIFILVNDRTIAEDLTQETFIRVYHSLDRFKGESSIYTWITMIARNVSIDYLRRKNRFLFFKLEHFRLESQEQSPQDVLLKNERIRDLYNAIKKLKLSYQEVLILRKVKGFSIKETSIILGWDETKVKNTTTRALSRLRKELMKRGDYNEHAI